MEQESRVGLLSRHPENWSQHDEFIDNSGDLPGIKIVKRRSTTHQRVVRSLISLSHQPLGLGRRFRSKRKIWRLLICYYNFVLITFIASLILSLWDAIFRPSYTNPPPHYKELENILKASKLLGSGNPRNEKIFIASNMIQHDLIRGSWGQNLLKLVDYLGPQNVFVSIYENDSGPEAPKALAWLRDQLKCEYSITFGDHISLSQFPTVVTPAGDLAIKRLTYLTEVRNRVLAPLDSPEPSIAINYTSIRFDRILFLNDIFYNAVDAVNLLFSTNLDPSTDEPSYDVACAIDFWHGATIYDTLVLHDTDGFEVDWFTYPWFTTQGSAISRADVLAQKDSVRVRSCWNGMAAYKATPFLRHEVVDPQGGNGGISGIGGGGTMARPAIPPLRFRSQGDLFWEASECCLLNADLASRNPGVQIYLNPYIRVAYSPETWAWEPRLRRIERGLAIMQWWMSKLRVIYEYNPRRTHAPGTPVNRRVWQFERTDLNGQRMGRQPKELEGLGKAELKGKWVNLEDIAEPGGFCGQKRLFVLPADFERENAKVAGESGGENWRRILEPPDWLW